MSHRLRDVLKNISIDCVIFGFEKGTLEILLVKRARKPFQDWWALPGGFIKKRELIEPAVQRILSETTGIEKLYMEEISVFDEVDRYPNWRVFTLGFFALISPENYPIQHGIDTTEVKWFKLTELPELPFDHKHILDVALGKLRARVGYKPIGFELLPEKFTLPQLQTLYECILDKKVDKRNFRKKILKMNLLKKLNAKDPNSKRRAASLYKFDRNVYEKLKNNGFVFEL